MTEKKSIKTINPEDIDENFTNYAKKWINKNLTSANYLPKYTPHLEIIDFVEVDNVSGKILVGVKCSLKWVDYRQEMQIDELKYPFEPKIIIKNVIKVESEVKTGCQVLNIIKIGKTTFYTMEKTYYWTLWLAIKNRVSFLSPFTKCISGIEMTLIKFSRTKLFSDHMKDKMENSQSTSKEYYGEFGSYKSHFRLFNWNKITKNQYDEGVLVNIKPNDYEIAQDVMVITLDQNKFFKVKADDILNIFLSSSVESSIDYQNNENMAFCLSSSTYPYVDENNRINGEIICTGRLKENIHNRGYSLLFEFRRNKILYDVLNLIPIWLILVYQYYSDLKVSDFINILFALIAYKFTLSQSLNESRYYNFADVIMLLSMILNLALASLKQTNYENQIWIINLIFMITTIGTSLIIILRHTYKIFELINNKPVLREGRIPVFLDSKERTHWTSNLYIVYNFLKESGMKNISEPSVNFSWTLYERVKKIAEQLKPIMEIKDVHLDVKTVSSINRKLNKKKNMDDLLRCRLNFNQFNNIISEIIKTNLFDSFYMDLDILTYRDPDNGLVGKVYLTNTGPDPITMEIQLCFLSLEIMTQLNASKYSLDNRELRKRVMRAKRDSQLSNSDNSFNILSKSSVSYDV